MDQATVVVIGGGATGTGIFRDLAMRGVDVVLLEQKDLAYGTSSRFHGLLHSGGRYAVKDAEAALSQARDELEERVRERTAELAKANIALNVLLKKRQEDRSVLTEQIVANTNELVLPYIDKLKAGRLSERQADLVEIIRANISELTSPFVRKFSTQLGRLTPTEIQVANLVRLGKRTKEIATIMRLSPGTISIHRKNIRKKLNLTNEKTNLQTCLTLNS